MVVASASSGRPSKRLGMQPWPLSLQRGPAPPAREAEPLPALLLEPGRKPDSGPGGKLSVEEEGVEGVWRAVDVACLGARRQP